MFGTDLIAEYILSCLGIEVSVFVFVLITMKMCSIKTIYTSRQKIFSRTRLGIDLSFRNFFICMV